MSKSCHFKEQNERIVNFFLGQIDLMDEKTIATPEWQAKKKQKIQEFAEKGITLSENSPVKE